MDIKIYYHLKELMRRYPLPILIILVFIYGPSKCGGQWMRASISNNVFNIVSIDSVLYAGKDGLFESFDHGESWHDLNVVLGNHSINVTCTAGKVLLIGTDIGISRSLDFGGHWSTTNTGLPTGSVYAMIGMGSNVFAAIGNAIFLSTDTGKSWISVNDTLIDKKILHFAVINQTLFVGTNHGLFRTIDTGRTWIEVDSALSTPTITSKYIYSLSVHGSSLYAVTYMGGLFRSTDEGLSWSLLNTNPGLFISIVSSDSSMFGGCLDPVKGIYISTDSGKSWSDISKAYDASIGYFTIHDATNVVVSGSNLVVNTTAMGIWFRSITSILSELEVKHKNTLLAGITNYPNPCSSHVHITVTTSKFEYAEVSISNLLGKECSRLYSGSLDVGKHLYEWDAALLPDGVYYCTVRSERGLAQIPFMVQH